MKMLVKKIVCLMILVYFLFAMLSCSTQRHACATYKGTYSNLYAKYKVKK